MAKPRDAEWARAKKLCRLSVEEVRMARELGLNPRKLVKNIPGPSQRWKLPVPEWVRELYRKRHGGPDPWEQPTPRSPRADRSMAAPLVEELPEFPERYDDDDSWLDPVADTPWRLEDEEHSRQRRQEEFRAAADYVAVALAALPTVEKVVLFGSVARPLEQERSRRHRFRHVGVTLPHECKDVDLAVWLPDGGPPRSRCRPGGRSRRASAPSAGP